MRKALERAATLSLLLLTIGLFANLTFGGALREDATNLTETHIGLSVIESLTYGAFAFYLLLFYRTTLRGMVAAWPFLLVCLYALCSTMWSSDPSMTLRRGLVLSATTLFGAYLGGRYPVHEFQTLLLWALGAMACVSLLLFFIRPTMVLDPYHVNDFRGLTEHKNMFGEYMAELLLVAICFTSKRRWVRGAVVVVALVMLLWAHSGSAMLAVGITFLFFPALFALRFRRSQAILLVIAGASLAAGFLALLSRDWTSVLDVLGKDSTLTGRSQLWSLVWEAIYRRPLLGYGFDSFWHGLTGESIRVISVVGWQVAHSHNGYLDVLLDFGLVGSCIVGLALLRTLKDALRYARSQSGVAALWPASFLIFCLVHALGEAGLIRRDGFSYLILVVVSTSTALRRSGAAALVSPKNVVVPESVGFAPLHATAALPPGKEVVGG